MTLTRWIEVENTEGVSFALIRNLDCIVEIQNGQLVYPPEPMAFRFAAELTKHERNEFYDIVSNMKDSK